MATEHAQALSTSFDAEAKAHEEVMAVLQAYHESLGKLMSDDCGTIDHSAGDAWMGSSSTIHFRATGYATMGIVGLQGRFDCTTNGNYLNLASRLCDIAAAGETLIGHHAFANVEDAVFPDKRGERESKGFRQITRI